ncbi:MAG: M48 family metalloprotease [Selenomonadaceae bacterium]|nr:M48 family metalloprotease [Selenomonadaceae bacterium]
MLKFLGAKKKFLSLATSAILGGAIWLGTPAITEANAAVNIIGIFVQGAAIKNQVNQEIKYFNETNEGRQKLYQTFRKERGVDESYEYNSRLDAIMTNLTNGVAKVDKTINDRPYMYFVAADDTLNAACGMGHVMFVNRGLFKSLSTEDEIAAVIGHEMGHGQSNHAAKSVDKQINKQITAGLLNVALGSDVLTSAVTAIALNHTDAHKDKKFETQADLLSIDYLMNTTYNPGATAAVMQKFVEMSIGAERSGLDVLFNPSDHPDSERRRDACAKKLTKLSGNHVTIKDGVVSINKKTFLTPAATSSMSSAERSYFVMGNLVRAYHNKQDKYDATVENGTVMLGNQAIITPVAGDEDAQTIADRLNALK